MKKKTILYLVSLFFLSVPLTGRGQDKKAWEIGGRCGYLAWYSPKPCFLQWNVL